MKYFYITSVRCGVPGNPTLDETCFEVEKRIDTIRFLKKRNWVLLSLLEITKEEYEEISIWG